MPAMTASLCIFIFSTATIPKSNETSASNDCSKLIFWGIACPAKAYGLQWRENLRINAGKGSKMIFFNGAVNEKTGSEQRTGDDVWIKRRLSSCSVKNDPSFHIFPIQNIYHTLLISPPVQSWLWYLQASSWFSAGSNACLHRLHVRNAVDLLSAMERSLKRPLVWDCGNDDKEVIEGRYSVNRISALPLTCAINWDFISNFLVAKISGLFGLETKFKVELAPLISPKFNMYIPFSNYI